MKEKAKKALTEINGSAILTENVSNFKHGYLLKGNQLQTLTTDYVGIKPPVERKFKTEKELAEVLIQNKKTLFGQDVFIFTMPKNKGDNEQSTPDFFMLDMGGFYSPKVYFMDIMVSRPEEFRFSRVTKLFLKEKENRELFFKLAHRNIAVNNALRQRAKLTKPDIATFFSLVESTKPTTLLITDTELNGLPELTEVYPLWRNVKSLVVKKYASNGNMLCTMTPAFNEIYLSTKQKAKGAPIAEEEHLKEVMPEVKEMFYRLKNELMKANTQLSWNSQKHYIALKASKKVAVFQFSRKKMTIVVMNPQKDIRANIKHYEIKTLTEKVQKFWNGECSTVVIDKAEHLDEVIKLLKKLIKD
ncbi:MAG TPA: hypothetical protein VK809_04475 [Bacteroidia bacterium]|jgi:predicted transport protein|nr:hypothetical protein [Bacteroidia bacterium]